MAFLNWSVCIFVALVFVTVSLCEEDCPCSWRDDNRSWDCNNENVTSVPTQCWPLYRDVDKIVFNTYLPEIKSDDFIHENLQNLTRLELQYAQNIADDALRELRSLIYLDVTEGCHFQLPDLSSLTELEVLEAGINNLTAAPSLVHMYKLHLVGIHRNDIQFVPDDYLPETPHSIAMTMVRNPFTELNATSIIGAPDGSSLVFDDSHLQYIWATTAQRDILLARDWSINVDLESIIRVTDDPTDP